MSAGGPIVGAGAVVQDADGRLLVVQRGRAPAAGRWSLPGGRVERGERAADTVVREVREETGLHVEVTGFVGFSEAIDDEHHVVILDFLVAVTGGTLAPGDDADDAAWVTRAELEALPTTDGLVAFLDAHGVVLA
jgi:ADP-ribose pyrophosphatase YjhB (NUDIX family)